MHLRRLYLARHHGLRHLVSSLSVALLVAFFTVQTAHATGLDAKRIGAVFQDEVDAAMDAAFAHGLAVTALHNHFFYDTRKVYFMHIGGQGNPETLAAGVKAVWGKSISSVNYEALH